MTSRSGGFAVLIILWMLALLALIADRMIIVDRSEIRIADNLRAAAVAEAAADGAIFEAVYRLAGSRRGGWKIDGRLHRLVIGRETVTLRVEDDANKINLNTAPSPLLQALLREVGVAAGPASQIGLAIAASRIQEPRQGAGARPGGPFQTIAELAAVPGITTDILARLAPHLTLDDPGGKQPGRLDPIVDAALREAPPTPSPTTASTAKPATPKPRTFSIKAIIGPVGDPTFERDAIVQIGSDQAYRIIAWSADRDW